MKKIILLFALCATFSSMAVAQSFKLAAGSNENLPDTIFVKTVDEGGTSVNISFYIWFQNTTSSTLIATFSQKSLSAIGGLLTWCGDTNTDTQCYTVDGPSDTFPINPGKSRKTNFHIEYTPSTASVGADYVRYTLKNASNNSDSATVVVCFSPTVTTTPGILDKLVANNLPNLAKEIKWNAYPNPTSNTVNISYTLPNGFSSGKAVVRNMVGIIVKEVTLNSSNGKISIPVRELPSGIYFYSLLLDEKIITTKKVIIKNN